MAINFRAVSADEVLVPVGGKGRKSTVSEFATCELGGEGYFLTEGIDYVLDNSEDENLPKLSSVRQRLLNYAKNWSKNSNKTILVKTESLAKKEEVDGKELLIPGLKFTFNEGERKARKKKIVIKIPAQNATQNTDTQEVAQN